MKEINTTTTYSEEVVKKFLHIFYFEKIKKIRILVNLLIIAIIIYFIQEDQRSTIDYITFGFALFGIIELNSSFLPWLNFYKLKRRKDKILNSKVKYTFKKNNFKINLNKDEYINYKDLKKVIEVDTAYYLYIDNSKAFIVSKENLSEEQINNLTNIFKEKVSTYKHKK